MAADQVKIVNSALIRLGADKISSITQDTKSARLANAIWDLTVEEVLRDHKWNFATKRVTLSPNGNTPEWGYDYEYDVPNDCLRVLDPDYPDIDFVVEDDKILCDESELNISYIYKNEDVSAWDSMFAKALSWKLSQELAYALTQSNTLVDAMEKGYNKALSAARSTDGAEGMIKGLEADTWTRARN